MVYIDRTGRSYGCACCCGEDLVSVVKCTLSTVAGLTLYMGDGRVGGHGWEFFFFER